MKIHHILKGGLIFLAFISFPAVDAFGQCETSVTIPPESVVDIGVAEGKSFVVSKSIVENGTLEVASKDKKNFLRYTAAKGKANASENVVCQIENEPEKIVEVNIRSIPSAVPDTMYSAAAKTLVLLFALAVLLESALAGIFKWRPFAEIFNPRAVRPLVAFLLAWWFVWYFDLDVVTALVNASNVYAPKAINAGGQILTALILAGGSSGINSILVALGFRQVNTPQNAPKPPPTKAWIAVRAIRDANDEGGDIDVMIGPMQTLSNAPAEPPYVGIIKGRSDRGILSFFVRDMGRFPAYGGFELDPAQELVVVLKHTNGMEKKWGPHKVGAGAIIDLDLKIE
ncbi:hypothetical protein ELH67_33210 (plasmid) [Rhizobium ruizarguesonis]|uniref:hypothetical protein n=1 Tax=Rhizobium TaxID=379 RepID=UPI000375296D|nr:hypothetical protein [Rhizobium ruizarguesonis]TAZ86955.1 hypothetical protein ELH67_33210 [Rhizobium ruizarguesonis]TBA31943.1 hypothetical protein ELH60_25785 [Rhizobium ruizarguesonis]TBC53353.1 hypothetical protein ELH36_34715 [Rhizobium ruizarguesonis]